MRHQTVRLVVVASLLGVMACGGADADNQAAVGDSTIAPASQSTEVAAPAAGVDSAAADTNTDALTLRPGDQITWTPSGPHRVQFGGTVTTPSGTQVTLTSFEDVSRILTDFQPALTADANGMAVAAPGARVTARVREDAAMASVPSFFFTCGVVAHRGLMVTKNFTIAPASPEHQPRDVQIISANAPFRWILRSEQGDINLTRA